LIGVTRAVIGALGCSVPGTILENRELIFSLGRKWNIRLPAATEDPTISRLTRIVAIVATDDDIPELFSWIKDRRLAAEVRASYVVKLQRFAKVPGAVRDFLLELLNDQLLGASAVRSLGKALGDGALPIFRQLQEDSPHISVREAALRAGNKIDARILRKQRTV
jgi:hypothetical protein